MESTSIQNKKAVSELYKRFIFKKLIVMLFILLLLVILMIIATMRGSASLSIHEVLSALFSSSSSSQLAKSIVWELRLPRILMAVVAGIALATAGTCMQAILRNPLASPYTLGIASGAGFGAALSIILGTKNLTVISAFIFSLIPALAILGMTKLSKASPSTMILAGIAMMYLFSALTSLLQYMGRSEDVAAVVYWLFGNLSKATWQNLAIVFLITLPLFLILFRWSPDFNALMHGDETASSLGVNAERIRLEGMMVSSLITASAVSFLGTIGFIGLVAPHITRMIIGVDHRYLIPASALLGALLLLASDTTARTLLSPIILPVGILTSFLGVPFFLYLIIQRGKEFW